MIGGMAGHPLFAALYDRMTARAERAGLADLRASALEGARGRTLELGAGTGANAASYPAAVTELVLIEPDPHMARRLREKLATSPPAFDYEVVETGGERLPRPDARLVLLEHIRDPADGTLGRWQDRLRRPWGWFAGGCRPNRDTLGTLAAAGFDVSGLKPVELPASPPIVRPAVRGSAAPPSG